jgi:DnaJ-class molecular chaperone
MGDASEVVREVGVNDFRVTTEQQQAPSGHVSNTTGISPIRMAGQPTPTTRVLPIFGDYAGTEDILSEIFGRQTRAARRRRGQDARYHLELSFLDAVNGGKQSIVLPDGSALEVNIPPGTRDGQILRLKGKGRPSPGDGPPGDALIEISVRPHPYFTRKGDDIHLDLPISLKEAVLGAKIKVPTPGGAVTWRCQNGPIPAAFSG